jgi:hypothetical protein
MKLVFDIETVRSYKELSDAPADYQDAWKYFAEKKYPELEVSEAYKKWAGLYPEFGKVVCFSGITNVEKKMTSYTGMDVKSKTPEWALLKLIADRMNRGDWKKVMLIGHNIKNFDIPYLVTRMIVNGITVPEVFKFGKVKPWELTWIRDTMDMYRQNNRYSVQVSNLAALCLVLGVKSPKNDLKGSEVGDLYWGDENGDAVEKITDYCEEDVLATGQVYNRLKQIFG